MKQYVYVMRCGAGFFKIGRSQDPNQRRRNLTTSRAQDDIEIVYLCGPFNDACKIENGAHAILKSCRMNGEWFGCSEDEAVNVVRSLAEGFVDSPDHDPIDTARSAREICEHFHKSELFMSQKRCAEITSSMESLDIIFSGYKDEIARLDQELCDAAKLIDEYALEAKQSMALARKSIESVERKNLEISMLREKINKLESAIQPSLLN